VVAQARREIQAAEQQVIALTPTALTAAQQALGALMRGE
jgi:hypothetical protein